MAGDIFAKNWSLCKRQVLGVTPLTQACLVFTQVDPTVFPFGRVAGRPCVPVRKTKKGIREPWVVVEYAVRDTHGHVTTPD